MLGVKQSSRELPRSMPIMSTAVNLYPKGWNDPSGDTETIASRLKARHFRPSPDGPGRWVNIVDRGVLGVFLLQIVHAADVACFGVLPGAEASGLARPVAWFGHIFNPLDRNEFREDLAEHARLAEEFFGNVFEIGPAHKEYCAGLPHLPA